jgi:hypothetical protein
MKLEAAGVNRGKKILAEPRDNHGKRSEACGEESKQKGPAVMEAALQHVTVSIPKAFKCRFEFPLKPDEHVPAARSLRAHRLPSK